MSKLNVSVLAYGRDSYLQQLKLYLTPLIYEGFVSLYEDAKKKEEEVNEFNGNEIMQFQTLLRDIPFWNQSILEEETRRILTEVNFLMQMVAAVFVAQVQILASVKLGGKNSQIRIKVPTSDIFIHAVYCTAAENIYYKPLEFRTYHKRESKEYIKETINKSIDEVINIMMPIESIIKEYVSDVFTPHIKENPRAVETVEEEAPGRILDHNDLGLNDDFSEPFKDKDNFDTPINDDFGIGKGSSFGKMLEAGEGGDDFANDLDVGKDSDLLETASKYDFKDDETDIFSSTKLASKDDELSPFKEAITDFKEEEPIFKATGGGNEDDPFKSSGDDPFKSSGDDDPFKSTGDDPFKSTGDDPFKSTGDDPFKSLGDDPFKNNSDIGMNLDDVPSPPELEKDGIFSQKPDEINFFEELP